MYTWIDRIVNNLIEKYKTKDVYELYDYLNIRIEKIDCNNILMNGNDSLYFNNIAGFEVVFIRDDLDFNLEKFILYHELGHSVLHSFAYAEFSKNYKNKYEKQANYFALKMMNIDLNNPEIEGMSLEQISSFYELPYQIVKGFLNK